MQQDNKRIFKFGKYKGQFISEVIKQDAKYVKWAHDNLNYFWMNAAELRQYNNIMNNINNRDINGVKVTHRNALEEELYKLLRNHEY